eukprot:scaffold258379_cov27-Tisochrysis_lutea.AAC.2
MPVCITDNEGAGIDHEGAGIDHDGTGVDHDGTGKDHEGTGEAAKKIPLSKRHNMSLQSWKASWIMRTGGHKWVIVPPYSYEVAGRKCTADHDGVEHSQVHHRSWGSC